MATVITGQVGYQKQSDGAQQAPMAQGRSAEGIVTELHGKYYEQTRRGFVYTASQAIGGVLATLYNATTASAAIANPPGSPKGLSLIRIEVVIKTLAGTPVVGYYTTSVSPTANATAVTGTALTAIPGLVGSGATPNGKAFTTATLPVAPSYYRPFAEKLTGSATTLPYASILSLDFDGSCILMPGTYLAVGQDAADTSNATIAATFVWEEVDL